MGILEVSVAAARFVFVRIHPKAAALLLAEGCPAPHSFLV